MRGMYKPYRTAIFWHAFVVNCEQRGSLMAPLQTGLKVKMEVQHECSKQDGNPKGEACKHCVRHWKQFEPNVETQWCLCLQHCVPPRLNSPETNTYSRTSLKQDHLESQSGLFVWMKTCKLASKGVLLLLSTQRCMGTLPWARGAWLEVLTVPVRQRAYWGGSSGSSPLEPHSNDISAERNIRKLTLFLHKK